MPSPSQIRVLCCGVLFLIVLGTEHRSAAAQDRITLDEVIPALSGTELGALELGIAPPVGSSRIVRRSEVLAALRRADRNARGLAIPTATRIERQAQELNAERFAEMVQPSVQRAIQPCEVRAIHGPARLTIAASGLDIRAEAQPPRRSGSTGAVVVFRSNGREKRVPIRADVRCPPPIIEPGNRVQVVVQVGAVRATAPGEARQPGRVGEIIVVRTGPTNTQLQAKILDGQQVEVVR
ncbi:MAG: flagella basal body P-ring formation protein FlgA [Myxococcota bacterium]